MVKQNKSKTYEVKVRESKLQEFNRIMEQMPGVRAKLIKALEKPKDKPRGKK
jgi:hypothetical protein